MPPFGIWGSVHHIAAGCGIGLGPFLLQRCPITVFQNGSPVLIDLCHHIVMGVGCFLNLLVIPLVTALAGCRVIGPEDHIFVEMILMGLTAQGAVDNGAGFGAGDGCAGFEGLQSKVMYSLQAII